jgi:chitinase
VASDDPDAALGYTELAVKYYLEQGLPADKLCIGYAIYGRGWGGVDSTQNGLYQPFKSIPKGTWDDGTSGATGVFDYKQVKSKVQSGELERYWDPQVMAPWAYSSSSQMMISYDDPESIQAKIDFVKKNGLGGLMSWDLSGDDNAELTTVVSTNYLMTSSKPSDKPAENPYGSIDNQRLGHRARE